MKSIQEEVVFELTINKSIFINHLLPVSSINDVKEKLEMLKVKHPNANHHCYAYLIGNHHEIQKYSDDGEPSRTAGYPMMDVLKKHDLTNVLSVSIRYFGGIKLGAGGLVRAYSKSTAGAIEKATFTTKKTYVVLHITIPFDYIGVTEKYIRDNYKLLETTYDSNVHYKISLLETNEETVRTTLTNSTKGVANITLLKTYEEYN